MQKYHNPNYHSRSISINDTDGAFFNKAYDAVTAIYSTNLGKQFLKALDATGKKLEIHPRGANECTMDDSSQAYYALRNYMAAGNREGIVRELHATLYTAEKSGVKRQEIAKRLSVGAPVVTGQAAVNVQLAPVNRFFSPQGGAVFKPAGSIAARGNLFEWLEKLHRWESGQEGMNAGAIDNLCFVLRDWLKPGKGSSCKVFFAPEKLGVCDWSRQRRPRPPAIGMAHEMVHAYLSMSGKRLYQEGTQADESMTAGLPPFQYEKFSENAFRAIWPGDVAIRMDYPNNNSITCFRCGFNNVDWKKECTRCKAPLDTRPDIPRCKKCRFMIEDPVTMKKCPNCNKSFKRWKARA